MQSISIDTRIALTYTFHQCLRQGWAFVSYRSPSDELPVTYIQKRPDGSDLKGFPDKQGFVFAPFDTSGTHKRLGIIPDIVIKGWEYEDALQEFPYNLNGYKLHLETIEYPEITQKTYLDRLTKLIQLINSDNNLQKVVLSRPIHIQLSRKLDTYQIYCQLCERYPNAFVYIFYHPEAGLWLGATPERLIRINDHQAEIVSLAGTQMSGDEHVWREKENQEQEIVTRYIQELLEKFELSDVQQLGPYTHDTGSVQHLKTELTARLSHDEDISQLINELHPTPAVCGYPQTKALDWIKAEEGYDRSYYTGYLGVFNGTQSLDLYVNLRCMQLFDRAIALYVGGGITGDSKADEEWEETEVKSQTLLDVVDNFL